ncbi:HlyD family secretion protein [Desulforamulus ruminis]|uniref:Secretion protein HlyD family protein n=1 Tax=Desulforamulus ruminis (strain ATCC 23193 / DSM 2154 / NCIMB 8452 / DL) TaxID=696281 RepID=F6DP20_DESRL|nr:efflux RND transporter periplasmic adaptor subunit [Desulforamulus ruminis]AEG60739.1 secretion protein HlyD family protein [Desulforamulus ruminis DSM 2154]
MNRRIIGILLIGLLAGASYWGYTRYRDPGEDKLTATGTIEATKVELSAKVSGTLENLTITSGDAVKKGQLVGLIVRNDLVAQKERDALGVLKAQAQLEDLSSGARAQEIKEAAANVNIAQANYEKAVSDFERYRELFQEGALPEAEYEKMATDLEVKQNQLDSAQAKLSLLEEGNRPQAVKAAEAELERSGAVLKASEAMLEDTKIFSPINGTVLSKNREPGEFLQMGASVATVTDLSDMWIKVYIATDDLPKIKLGQKVSFTVSGSEIKHQGLIDEIASQGEFTPKSIQTKQERANIVYRVKIRIDNAGGTLKPGMPADVVFD